MTQNKRLEKFSKLVSDKPSNFLAKLEYYKINKKWLDNSSKVAISVLQALREKGWTQKDLAEKLNVSAQQINKIVKGQQNLTFETIGKLEDALEISLLQIIEYKSINEIKTTEAIIQAVQETISDEISISTCKVPSFSEKFDRKHVAKMKVIYIKNKQTINYLPKHLKAVSNG
jgi:transcriptional regulator with XRE-family HTH domain